VSEMKIKSILNVFVFLTVALLSRIFFPWWGITLLFGVVACIAVLNWFVREVGVKPFWAKTVMVCVVSVFVISGITTFVENRTPWVAKAFANYQTYMSLKLADLLNLQFPSELAMELNKTEEAMFKAEQFEFGKKLREIRINKIEKGIKLTDEDRKVLQEAKNKRDELAKEMPKSKIVPEDKKAKITAIIPKSGPAQENKPSVPARTESVIVASVPSQPVEKSPPAVIEEKVEWVYLGRDVKKIIFPENAHLLRTGHFKMQLDSVEILSSGRIKFDLIQTAFGKETLFWVNKPEENIYLSDEKGRRSNFVEAKDLRYIEDAKNPELGNKVFPAGVAVSYSLVFTRLHPSAEAINLVINYRASTNFSLNARHLSGYTYWETISKDEPAVFRDIKLFQEKALANVQKEETMPVEKVEKLPVPDGIRALAGSVGGAFKTKKEQVITTVPHKFEDRKSEIAEKPVVKESTAPRLEEQPGRKDELMAKESVKEEAAKKESISVPQNVMTNDKQIIREAVVQNPRDQVEQNAAIEEKPALKTPLAEEDVPKTPIKKPENLFECKFNKILDLPARKPWRTGFMCQRGDQITISRKGYGPILVKVGRVSKLIQAKVSEINLFIPEDGELIFFGSITPIKITASVFRRVP